MSTSVRSLSPGRDCRSTLSNGRRERSVLVLIALSIAGYPMIAALSSILASESALPSIGYRLGIASLAIWVLLRRPLRVTPELGWFVAALCIFWTMYLSRILIDGFVRELPLQLTGPEYLSYSVLFCLIPSLGALRGIHEENVARDTLIFTFVLAVVSLSLTQVAFFRAITDLSTIFSTRAALEKLNPISLGHLGVSVVLMSMVVRSAGMHRAHGWMSPMTVFGSAVGFIAAMLSGSKGPIVAMLVCMVLFFWMPLRSDRRALWILILTLVMCLLLTVMLLMSEELAQFQAAARLLDLISGKVSDESTHARVSAYVSAFEQFCESPLWGDSLVERVHNFYPHNVLLEAAMATGLMGLLPFLMLMGASVRGTLRALADSGPLAWLHLLNIQYLIAAMFSGGIFGNSQMWFLMVICYASTRFKEILK